MHATHVDFELLATFVAVADAASFSKAARKRGVSKGTISRSISRLESLVGAELIHRTTHRVALSTAGTALYERAAPHLIALAQAVGGLPERAAQPSGELRITAPPDFGSTILPGIIAQFALRHPDVTFDVRITNVQMDLVGEGFDLAVRASSGRLSDSTLTVRKLGGAELRYYASPTYVARRGDPKTIGDGAHTWVAFSAGSFESPPRNVARLRLKSDDFFFIRDLLRDGLGVGPLPTFLADPYLRSGALVSVAASQRLRGPGGYYLLYPSRGQVPRKVAVFRDFLVEHLATHPLDGY